MFVMRGYNFFVFKLKFDLENFFMISSAVFVSKNFRLSSHNPTLRIVWLFMGGLAALVY